MGRADRPARLRVGTSGFSYPAWRGAFYPRDLPPGDMLRHYAGVLDCVELGYTAERVPTDTLLASWRRQTPAAFRFVLKVPKRVTHELRLADASATLRDFVHRCGGLGMKLGALLVQTPPHLHADLDRLDALLAALPPDPPVVLELHHESWHADAVHAVLRRHRATLCVTDSETGSTPMVATAPLGYVRLRRSDYDDEALAAWVTRIRAQPGWKRVFVFFKHDATGRAGILARRLRALSGPSSA